jgi:prophage regulatory protein
MSGELALMGVTEIHRRIGGSRGRVRQMTSRKAPPAPIEVLRLGWVWLEAEVEAWIRVLPAEEIDPSPMAG